MTEGSAPKRLRQKPSLRTTALICSCRRTTRNVRPAIGVTPRTSKTPLVTHCLRHRFGRPVLPGHHHAAHSRNESRHLLEGASLVVPVEHVQAAIPDHVAPCRFAPKRSQGGRALARAMGEASVASASAKMAPLAPIPSASVITATNVNPGADSAVSPQIARRLATLRATVSVASLDLAFCQGLRRSA